MMKKKYISPETSIEVINLTRSFALNIDSSETTDQSLVKRDDDDCWEDDDFDYDIWGE